MKTAKFGLLAQPVERVAVRYVYIKYNRKVVSSILTETEVKTSFFKNYYIFK